MAFNPPRCNCPDAINKRSAVPGADSLSLQIPSDWSEGFKGVRSVGGYCIHELAVLRVRKEVAEAFPNGVPADIKTPLPPTFISKKVLSQLQQPSSLGDDFST